MIRLTVSLLLIIQLTHCSPKEKKVNFYQYIPESSWGILNDLLEYHSDTILLTGLLHYKYEDVALYQTIKSRKSNALWLSPIEGELIKKMDSLDTLRVKILGVIDTTAHGHLNLYAGEFWPIFISRTH